MSELNLKRSSNSRHLRGKQLVLPAIVRAVYVRPNEISIERPYIFHQGLLQPREIALRMGENDGATLFFAGRGARRLLIRLRLEGGRGI